MLKESSEFFHDQKFIENKPIEKIAFLKDRKISNKTRDHLRKEKLFKKYFSFLLYYTIPERVRYYMLVLRVGLVTYVLLQLTY